MDIQIGTPKHWWIKKIRNGCWAVMYNKKKHTEHSTQKGAEDALKRHLKVDEYA